MFLGIDLSKTPSFKHDMTALIPLFSGLSAWLLCFVQNKINILQMAQGNVNKVLTTLFHGSVLSTYFAVLVPAGVGLYWIFGNLFAIPFMYLYNICMPPKKYIDYEYLKKMNEQRIEKEKQHKKYNAREKEDYKKFFAVQDMKLMFYSESNGFYKVLQGHDRLYLRAFRPRHPLCYKRPERQYLQGYPSADQAVLHRFQQEAHSSLYEAGLRYVCYDYARPRKVSHQAFTRKEGHRVRICLPRNGKYCSDFEKGSS